MSRNRAIATSAMRMKGKLMSNQLQENITRRRILVGLGNLSLAGALIGLGRGALNFLTPPVSSSQPAEIEAGPPEGFAVGLTPLPDGRAFIGRDDAGLFAVSAICTHLGCTVARAGDELACPCHASRFTLDGDNLTGPAALPLPHLKLSLDDRGLLKIHPTEPVSATIRLKLL